MGWGKTGNPGDRRTVRPNDEWNRAAALCAGQLPLVWLAWWLALEAGGDDYGYPGGAYLGICCVPVVLPLLGLVHATLQITPAAALAGLRPGALPGPEWAWHLGVSVLIGAGWSVLGRLLWGWPLGDTLPWFAGAGVLPVLVLDRLRGRPWRGRRVWLGSAVASFVLFVGCGIPAAALTDTYEPPRLSAGQLTGDWHGAHGSLLRLNPDGRAELTRLPARRGADEEGDFSVCDGTGTWTLERENEFMDTDRDGVLLRPNGECGGETYWTVGGTEQDPELFVVLGDPDSGDLRILTRD
ncbi:hypothetical protein OHA99_21355 [Streptomyces coelicoflavus]|uniref:hypothetical protein n=1 Tax=Streptomyces TaxID=1883 RepID=UPI0012922FF6|nr:MULTISPECIES: hypothetical protein [Streptomyces]MCX5037187.1 hypothetical protein [Streptomyces coelicoflavus]QFX83350.1 hypothetical protein GEV49_22435 [Streptomyces sp. SYP-A7193]